MSGEPKDFKAAFDADARRTPVRVAFVTRRATPHVRLRDDENVMTYPEALLRAAIAVEALLIVLTLLSLFQNAPLEGLADPMQTPNPAKAPWYFLGLQELLHYFPPVVGGVLIPTLVVLALIVIPYFGINVEDESFWLRNRAKKLNALALVTAALSAFLVWFEVYAVFVPTLLVAIAMWFASTAPTASTASTAPARRSLRGKLHLKPLSFWIMSWFLFVAITLTVIGTFFRGAGWALVWPWNA